MILYGLNGKPPFVPTLAEVRAYAVDALKVGESADVTADGKTIGRMTITGGSDDMYGRFDPADISADDPYIIRRDGTIDNTVRSDDPSESTHLLTTLSGDVQYTFVGEARALRMARTFLAATIKAYPQDEGADEAMVYVMGVFAWPDRTILGYTIADGPNVMFGSGEDWRIIRENGTLGKKVRTMNGRRFGPTFAGPTLDDWESMVDGSYAERADKFRQEVSEALEMNAKGKVADADDCAPALGKVTDEETKANKKAGRRAARRLADKYGKDECNAATTLLRDAIKKGALTDYEHGGFIVRNGTKWEFDWSKAESVIEDIVLAKRAGRIADTGLVMDICKERMEAKAKAETEAEAPAEDAAEDAAERIRPVDAMDDGELSDALYELNELAHVFFRAQELYTVLNDISAMGGGMGLRKEEAGELMELQHRVMARLGDIYDARTMGLIGREVRA